MFFFIGKNNSLKSRVFRKNGSDFKCGVHLTGRVSYILKKSALILAAVACCINFCFPIHIYAESSNVVASKKIYHKHTGNSEDGGGCYTIENMSTRTEEKECRGTMVYWPDLGTSSCSKCGAAYKGDESDRLCFKTKQEVVKYWYYELGCGANTTSAIGTLSVSKDTQEWARSVVLTGSYENKGGLKVGNNAYIWNGGSATSKDTFEVTACGQYTLSLNLKNKENATGNKVTVAVNNVDNTPPKLDISYDRESLVKSVEISVLGSDLQPDGTVGCGLHETPYSFDGGNTWTADSVFVTSKNGVLKMAVKDQLENISYIEENIQNIDSTGPVITYKVEPVSWTNGDVEVYLSAEDRGDNGGSAAGLPEEWYSIDGGKNWSGDLFFKVTKNQTVTVTARDLLGNQTKEKIVISHIDKDAPEIRTKVESDGANKKKARIQVDASDTGAGLHDTAYSWDDGVTYTSENTFYVSQNGTYCVWVRDKVGNVAKDNVEVDIIKEKGSDEPEPKPEESEEESSHAEENESEEEAESQPESEVIEEETSTDANLEEDIEETIEEDTEETVEETTEELPTETESIEETTEEVVMTMEELVDEPAPVKIRELKEKNKWSIGEIVALIILLSALLLMSLFLLFLWVRTIAVYAKNSAGHMEYKGRLWIHNREERYEVEVSGQILERCETNHMCFCPSILFAKFHEEEEIHFLLPDGICVTLPIARKMEME